MSELWHVLVNENMHDAGARIYHGDPYPLDGWTRVWSCHDTKEEAEAELAKAREHAEGRRLP